MGISSFGRFGLLSFLPTGLALVLEFKRLLHVEQQE